MVAEMRAEHFIIPKPIVFGIGGSVDSDISATIFNKFLERFFLFRSQNITRCRKKNHHFKAAEVIVVCVRFGGLPAAAGAETETKIVRVSFGCSVIVVVGPLLVG